VNARECRLRCTTDELGGVVDDGDDYVAKSLLFRGGV
jgi:hypothetical protein